MNIIQNTYTHGDIDAFRQNMTEIYEDICKRAYATIIPFDLLVIMLADDAIDLIRDRGLYRQKVKQQLRIVEAEADQFKKATRLALSRRQDGLGENRFLLVQNMGNEMLRRLEPDIFKLRMSVKSFLDKNRQPDSEFRSHVILADIMLDFSVQLFNEFFEAYHKRTSARFHYDFTPARLSASHTAWHTALNILFHDSPSLDLNKDANTVLAYRVINARLANGDLINESGITAMGYDSEYVKILEEEKRNDTAEELSQKFKVKK